MTEEELAALIEEEDAAMQAANADWNSRVLACEAATAPLAIDDFDEEDRERGRGWNKEPFLPWGDSVAWMATRSPDVMEVLRAYRSYQRRSATIDGATIERAVIGILRSYVAVADINQAARDLRAFCIKSSLVAISNPTGQPVQPLDWQRGSEPRVGRVPDVLFPTSELLAISSVAIIGPSNGEGEEAPEVDSIDLTGVDDETASSVRHAMANNRAMRECREWLDNYYKIEKPGLMRKKEALAHALNEWPDDLVTKRQFTKEYQALSKDRPWMRKTGPTPKLTR